MLIYSLFHLFKKLSNIYRNVFLYFHSIFWHAIDVVVILLIRTSIPFYCSCLQYYFLYLS